MASRKKTKKTKKKKASIKVPHTAAAFTVVLEDLKSMFKVYGEGLEAVRDDLRGFRGEFEGFRGEVDRRFDAVDRRFDAVDARSDRTERELALVKSDVGLVKTAVLENSRELRELRGAMTRVVNRDEVEAIVARALAR